MADNEPDFTHGVYRVMHFLLLNGVRYTCESDLIFIDDNPFVVLEWAGPQENQHPDLKLALDPAHLEERQGQPGYFLYNGDLVDPRMRH